MTVGRSRHLGLDLGGTNLKWVVVERDGDGWERLDSGSVPTRAGGPGAIVPQLVEVGRAALDGLAAGPHGGGPAVTSVGVGVPGLYDPVAGTSRFFPNVPGDWAGVPVAAPIAEGLRLPTRMINDARAFALAESRLGAGRGARTMLGVTLGTGVGGGIVLDGRLLEGLDGTAGEMGHQTIDPDGPWCGCGNRGCVEAYARADQIVAACGTESVEAAIAAARAGDERASGGLRDVGRYLGIGLANMVTVLTPDRVVIGGGVAAAGDAILAPVRAEIVRRVKTTFFDPEAVVTAELGTWAGAIGAAVHGAEQAAAATS